MMGLGNGRRSMKSPPLILAALVACVIVLGFNYWIASSRSVELQTRIVELEGRVRRAAAERGAVELKKNEFQGELQKQREQLDRIQSSHSFQLENVNKLHQDEKAVLVNNITTGEKLIRDLQDQLKALQRSYSSLQQDIFQFQKNQTSLEKKFSYDLNQCISQMTEVKEQCDERIEEVIRKRNEAPGSRDLAETNNQHQQALKPQPKLQEEVPSEEQMPQEKGDVPRNKSQIPAPNSESLGLKPQVQNEETNEIQAVGEEHQQASIQGQAVADGTRVGAEKLDQHTQLPAGLLARPEEDSQYPEREQLVIRDRQEQQRASEEGGGQKNPGDEYDMDENEAESEREKQAALAGNDRNINVLNADAQKRGIINVPVGSERQSHILNQVGIHIPQQA
ncbi:Golgi membrane protein 1 [Mus musculus]|uniref:Golgi membrane protein 1 n=1 Tax=Mus musculus TaxID=10090 RepID=GOLM1_MOUSE|nr:Golgi membrane protein 1 [Mus musculus]NP_081583.3 Golgi membrane protein 1 [Mus musculus]Q91XA2.2 RecName: Full=Golgi membrane protein 1; AltName: Full=Golgi membrane protein GP73; AltName: Full=Golgi phosphoprotein 2 [Mus musculus]EDL41283.1 golgi phosphoprotein 2, isoform CRA_a [Mus musculus]EDL41284.1 golgi phosphoprotein 2, isoform CRA_a [Mus musculus]|eukprot:NP_001030294.1 Golgi membrane protein 1 [Mus musculus]